jgi:hypothetical protein
MLVALKRGTVDLKALEPEKTHFVKMPLENDVGTVSLLLSVTGTYGGEIGETTTEANISSSVSTKEAPDSAKYRENIFKKYVRNANIRSLLPDLKDTYRLEFMFISKLTNFLIMSRL